MRSEVAKDYHGRPLLPEAVFDRYWNGKCDVFAHALWLAHGKGRVRVYAGRKYCHIFYVHESGKLIDVFGTCTHRTVRRRYPQYRKVIDHEARELWTLRKNAEHLSKRNGGHVAQALKIIRQNSGRYLLPRN